MKIKNIVLWGSLWGVIYFGVNNLMLFTPCELTPFHFEKNISFSERWMVPYISWLFYNLIFCFLIKHGAKEFTLLVTGLVLIHALIFIFFPVIYPRTYNQETLCEINKFLLSCDRPQNCLPSLHVSFIFFTLLIAPYLGISQKMHYLFIIWGIIIMISVIFVKQHYLLDVLAGIILTTIYFFVFLKTEVINKKFFSNNPNSET